MKNSGAADVDNARLYIWNDQASPNEMLKLRGSSKYYAEFDITAMEEKTVHFEWEVRMGGWTGFRAEVNPKCSVVNEAGNADCDQNIGRFINELNRYGNNDYPSGGGIFQQDTGADNVTVEFLILPDFVITDAYPHRSGPYYQGNNLTLTATIANIGPADWSPLDGVLTLSFDDGKGATEMISITKAIDSGDKESFVITEQWVVPNRDSFNITFELDYEGYELSEANNDFILSIPITPGEGNDNCDDSTPGFALPQLAIGGAAAMVVMASYRRGRRWNGGGQVVNEGVGIGTSILSMALPAPPIPHPQGGVDRA